MNKNISVWRGDKTPPTKYHIWYKSDGSQFININEEWINIIDLIPDASNSERGLMTSQDKIELSKKVNKEEGKSLVSNDQISKLESLKDQETIDSEIEQSKQFGIDAQTAIDHHEADKLNPHQVTAAQVNAYDKTQINNLINTTSTLINSQINQLSTKINKVNNDLDTHIEDKDNPHQVTKQQLGLGNVNNTSDADKPISTATQTELTKINTSLSTKANQTDLTAHINNKSNPHEVTKQQIGLNNVTNDSQVKRSEMGSASGVATLDVNSKIPVSQIPNFDASKIVSGTIDIERLPKGALERLTIVANAAARKALTDVQNGDTVKETDTGLMYYVKDDTRLSTDDGWEVYTAASATSVPWSGVTGKPVSYNPSAHTHANISVTGTGSLEGGGDLSTNRTITHKSGNAPNKTSALYKFSTDSTSHINSVTAVTKADITSLGIPSQDTTYSDATTSKSGLMSASDKTKLNNIQDLVKSVSSPLSLNNGTLSATTYNGTTTISSTSNKLVEEKALYKHLSDLNADIDELVDNFVIIPLNPQVDPNQTAKCTFTEEEKNAVMEAYDSDIIPIFKFTMPDGIIKYDIPTKVTNGFDTTTSNLKVPLFLNWGSGAFSINIQNITKEIWLGFNISLQSFKGSQVCPVDYVFNVRSNQLYYNNNNNIKFRIGDRHLNIVKTYSENDQLVLITDTIIYKNKRYYCEIRFPIGPIVQDTDITYIFKPETTLQRYGYNNQNLKLSTGGSHEESVQLYNDNYGWRKVIKDDNGGFPAIILISDITTLINAETTSTFGFSGEIDYFRINQGIPQTQKVFVQCTCGYNANTDLNWELYTSYPDYIFPLVVKRGDNYYLALNLKSHGRTFTMSGNFTNCLTTFESILAPRTGSTTNNFPEIDGIEYIKQDLCHTYYRFNNLVSLDNLSTQLQNQVKTTYFIINQSGAFVEDEANEITISDENNKTYTLTELLDICEKYHSNQLHNLQLKIGMGTIIKNPIIYKGTNVIYGNTYQILVNSLSSSSDIINGLMQYDIYINSGQLKLFYKFLKYHTDGNS